MPAVILFQVRQGAQMAPRYHIDDPCRASTEQVDIDMFPTEMDRRDPCLFLHLMEPVLCTGHSIPAAFPSLFTFVPALREPVPKALT